MKIRIGFVSNSSSSSFVLAIKKDAKFQDVYAVVKKNREYIKDLFEHCEPKDFYEIEEEAIDPDNITLEQGLDIAEKIIAKDLFNSVKGGMELGDWLVWAGEASNEESDLVSNLIYSGDIVGGEDIIKIRSF